MENLLDKTTQLWVKATRKKIDAEKETWLLGPIRNPTLIGDHYIHELAQSEDLEFTKEQHH